MAALDSTHCRKLINDYLIDHEDGYICSNNKLKNILSTAKFKVENISSSATQKSGWFSKNKTLDIPDVIRWTEDYSLDDDRKLSGWRFIINDLLTNIDEIHCIVGEQIIFYKNKFIFIQSLDGETSIKDSDFLFDIEDLNNIDYWVEEFDSDNNVGHFTISTYSDSPEALFQPTTIIEHITKIRDLIISFYQGMVSNEFRGRRSEVLDLIPADGNGNILLSDCADLDKLTREYQPQIIQIDRSYIQKFVKVSQFLKTKRENIRRIFEALKGVNNINELEALHNIIVDEIHIYNLVFLHSLNMISSLVDEDMISFYETFELFDSLNIFDSQWEKETSQRLDGISDQIESMNQNLGSLLSDILHQSQKMEARIVGAINNLSQISERGFSSISSKLGTIHSTLQLNTLLSRIQIYQNYLRLKH